jgi:hypothetical protein
MVCQLAARVDNGIAEPCDGVRREASAEKKTKRDPSFGSGRRASASTKITSFPGGTFHDEGPGEVDTLRQVGKFMVLPCRVECRVPEPVSQNTAK